MQQDFINRFFKNPRNIFFFDGFGALLSAFNLGIILPLFSDFFGVPKVSFYVLVFFPLLFVLFDLIVAFRAQSNWSKYLKIIAFANLSYCLFSIIWISQHFQTMHPTAWIYFILEVSIIILLSRFEFKLASSI